LRIVSENLGVKPEEVSRATSFLEDVGADSLDVVELAMELEEEFEITIETERIKTICDALAEQLRDREQNG
jgi:acyl carrier protein